MKKLINLVVVLVLALSLSTAFADIYPRTGVIVKIYNDVAVIEDGAGFLWEIDEPEDMIVGDVVSMIMVDNGTPESIFDDAIVEWRYGGFTLPVVEGGIVK